MPDVSHDLNELKQLPQERKTMLGFFLLVLFTLGFLVGVLYTRNKKPSMMGKTPSSTTPSTGTTAKKPTTALAISPATKVLKVGQSIPVSVVISKEPVQAVDVVLTYDPEVFTVSNVVKGDLFPMKLRQKLEQGKIALSASVTPDSPAATGNGDIFTFSLTAISATPSSTVDFDKKDTITAKNGENTLGETTPGKYTVQE